MTELTKLQQAITEALFSHNIHADMTHANRLVKAQGELSAEQRLGIYRNSTHGILSQHLNALYPVCRQLIGEQRFQLLCDLFIDEYAPETPYLPEFGERLGEFLAQHESLKDTAYIVDIAHLEWARHSAWHQPNQPPADFSQLAQCDEQQQAALCFELPTSSQLLQSDTAIDALWLAHQEDDVEAALSKLDSTSLNLQTHLIIWRQRRQLKQCRLTQLQWLFLTEVQQGKTLEALSAQFDTEVTSLLATAVQEGWVCGFN